MINTRALLMNSIEPPIAGLTYSSWEGQKYFPKKSIAVLDEPIWKCTGRLQVRAHLPQTVPVAVRQVRRAEILRVGGHVDTPQPDPGDPLGLLHAPVDVPRRQDRHPDEPAPGLVAHLGHGVVVDLDTQPAQLRVADLTVDALAAQTDDAREQNLRVDTALVHHLQARLGVERAPMDPVLALLHRIQERDPLPLPVDHPTAPGETQRLPVDHPGRLTVDLLHVRNPVLEPRRRPRRPHVVRLGEMRIRVDDPNTIISQRGHDATPLP